MNIDEYKASSSSSSSRRRSTQWLRSNPRIVRVSRTFGGKDRHSKVCTIRGLRDRRIRLSVATAIELYDLQHRLGLAQPSKVIDWLLDVTTNDIDKLPPLDYHHHHHHHIINIPHQGLPPIHHQFDHASLLLKGKPKLLDDHHQILLLQNKYNQDHQLFTQMFYPNNNNYHSSDPNNCSNLSLFPQLPPQIIDNNHHHHHHHADADAAASSSSRSLSSSFPFVSQLHHPLNLFLYPSISTTTTTTPPALPLFTVPYVAPTNTQLDENNEYGPTQLNQFQFLNSSTNIISPQDQMLHHSLMPSINNTFQCSNYPYYFQKE